MTEYQRIIDIMILAKNKGLKDVSIRIYDKPLVVLYVGEKDRWECKSLSELLESLKEHEESLSWMNEETK